MARDELSHSLSIDGTVAEWFRWFTQAPALELADPAPNCTWRGNASPSLRVDDRLPTLGEFAAMIAGEDFCSILIWFRMGVSRSGKRFAFFLEHSGEGESGWDVTLTPLKDDDFYLWDSEFREILEIVVRSDFVSTMLEKVGLRIRIGVEYEAANGMNDVSCTCHSADDVLGVYDSWVSTLYLDGQ